MNLTTLKSSVSLQAFAADHLTLKPVGKDLKGLCPLHKERTPSFVVHDKYWKCFGCGESGDVIDLAARLNGVTKGAAIAMLAERYGVSLTRDTRTRTQRIYDAEEKAFAEWWWKRQVRAMGLKMAAYLRYGSDDQCEALGRDYQRLREFKDRVGLAERCATQEDREEWTWEKEWGKVWLSLATS